jgi:hypothetical protein
MATREAAWVELWRKELQCLPQAFAGAVAPTAFAFRQVSVVFRP